MSGLMGFCSGRSLHGVTVHTGRYQGSCYFHLTIGDDNHDCEDIDQFFVGRNVRSLEALLELIKGGYR